MIFESHPALKPDYYPQFERFIQVMWDNPWNAAKFSFQSDIQDFKTELTEAERTMITRALSAIGQVEVKVKAFWGRLGDNLPHPTLTDLGQVMSGVEVVHKRAYSRLLDVLGIEQIYHENLKVPAIQGRLNYLGKHADKVYKDKRRQYVYALILFTLFVENVSLFSQFYIVLWFKRYRNVLKDTAQQVLYTRNEETIHSLVGIELINTIRHEHPELFDAELEMRVMHEAQEALTAESAIVDWMVGEFDQEGLSAPLLKEYIKSRINESLTEIGFAPVFHNLDTALLDQTLWMDEGIKGNNQADFFHRKPTEYAENNAVFDEDSMFDDASLVAV